MQFGKSIGIACSSFAITNIDDMFVLVTFFSEAASTSKTLTPLRITLGQYLGFTVIVVISMIGFGASLALPAEPIGFLGLLPILMGVWNLLGLIRGEGEEEEEEERDGIKGMKSVLKVAAITVMNGGDNIGTYVPLFAQAKGAEVAVYVVVYYILIGVWCLVALLVMRQKHVLPLAKKYMRAVIPFLYLGLGAYIIAKSSCYPWSIERIDKSASTNRGNVIMAVVTTVLLLICIGAMLVLKLRRKEVQDLPDGEVPPEGDPPRSPEIAEIRPRSASFHSQISSNPASKETVPGETIDAPTGAAQSSAARTSTSIANDAIISVEDDEGLSEVKVDRTASTALSSYKVDNK